MYSSAERKELKWMLISVAFPCESSTSVAVRSAFAKISRSFRREEEDEDEEEEDECARIVRIRQYQ